MPTGLLVLCGRLVEGYSHIGRIAQLVEHFGDIEGAGSSSLSAFTKIAVSDSYMMHCGV